MRQAPGAAQALARQIQPRTPDDVVPQHYDLALAVDPDSSAYSGRVDIVVDIRRAVDKILLHAHGLQIDRAALHAVDGAVSCWMCRSPPDSVARR